MSQLTELATRYLKDSSTEYEVLQGLIDEFIDQVEYKEAMIDKQLSHLRLLAEEVLKAHLIEEWDTMEDQIVERPCQCHVCKVAREVMG